MHIINNGVHTKKMIKISDPSKNKKLEQQPIKGILLTKLKDIQVILLDQNYDKKLM